LGLQVGVRLERPEVPGTCCSPGESVAVRLPVSRWRRTVRPGSGPRVPRRPGARRWPRRRTRPIHRHRRVEPPAWTRGGPRP